MADHELAVVDESAAFPFRFRAAAAQGVLLLLRCRDCHRYNPLSVTVLCVSCGSLDLVSERVSGRGTVLSLTYVARPSDSGGPRTVVFVELEEGVRLLGTVRGDAEAGCDDPLSFAYRDHSSGALLFDR